MSKDSFPTKFREIIERSGNTYADFARAVGIKVTRFHDITGVERTARMNPEEFLKVRSLVEALEEEMDIQDKEVSLNGYYWDREKEAVADLG